MVRIRVGKISVMIAGLMAVTAAMKKSITVITQNR